MVTPTGRDLSNECLAFHSATDGVDVEAVGFAWLQVGDLSICVGGDGQRQGPRVGAITANGGVDHLVTRHLGGWTLPGYGDLHV